MKRACSHSELLQPPSLLASDQRNVPTCQEEHRNKSVQSTSARNNCITNTRPVRAPLAMTIIAPAIATWDANTHARTHTPSSLLFNYLKQAGSRPLHKHHLGGCVSRSQCSPLQCSCFQSSSHAVSHSQTDEQTTQFFNELVHSSTVGRLNGPILHPLHLTRKCQRHENMTFSHSDSIFINRRKSPRSRPKLLLDQSNQEHSSRSKKRKTKPSRWSLVGWWLVGG